MHHVPTASNKPIRCAIYSRFSDDQQNARSASDQTAACRKYAESQGWTVVAVFEDLAMSGASSFRPAYQRMQALAQQRGFDVLLAEGLDRLNRRLANGAQLYDLLTFLNIQIHTLQDGLIQPLQVGIMGTMSQLFLNELRHKTRRGLTAVANEGRSAGGLCYGYRAVLVSKDMALKGLGKRGGRVIETSEAAVINRIFQEYADGRSPKAIAVALNNDGIKGPAGGQWGPSAINGNRKQGTGIINNKLYIGQQIWNRRSWIKDPSTGRRVARPNSDDALIVTEVPSLRIVPDKLWKAVKARQAKLDQAAAGRGSPGGPAAFWSKQRPKFLFSGLMRCGACGSGYSKSGVEHFSCSAARSKGATACTNRLTIRRDALESTVLAALRSKLLDPGQFEVYAKHFVAEWNRQQSEASAQLAVKRAEVDRLKQQLSKLVDALADGAPVHSVKDRMAELEGRKLKLMAELEQAEQPAPRLFPNMGQLYRERVAELIDELQADDSEGLRTRLRSLVDEVRLVPEGDDLRVEVRGALAGILHLATGGAGLDGASAGMASAGAVAQG